LIAGAGAIQLQDPHTAGWTARGELPGCAVRFSRLKDACDLLTMAMSGVSMELSLDSKGSLAVRNLILLLALAGIVTGCENMSTSQKGAVTGAALGSGIGMVAGGSFGQVVGAGLIGGAAGYITGSAIQNR
jgi:hypothetical protein